VYFLQGSTSVQTINLHSEFQQHMKVMSLSGRDQRLTFVKIADVGVKPFSSSPIGELQFDPQVACSGMCYLGIDYDTQGAYLIFNLFADQLIVYFSWRKLAARSQTQPEHMAK